jgi:hypothetical protein
MTTHGPTIMKRLLALLAIAASLTAAGPAQSDITLGFQPASSTATVGESFDIELWIYGLGAADTPALSAFDVDVGFNQLVLGFNGATFGPWLDVFSSGLNWTFVQLGSGTINLAEISLDLPQDLVDNQPDSFVLATLTFDAIASGSSGLTITRNVLGDALGDPITATEIGGATVTVSPAAVPEPASPALLAAALLALVAASRRRR